jgi:hypothetical protein
MVWALTELMIPSEGKFDVETYSLAYGYQSMLDAYRAQMAAMSQFALTAHLKLITRQRRVRNLAPAFLLPSGRLS